MNRIQKKCLTVSVGIHLLLAIILIVGPALMPSEDKPQSMELLPWIPALASDGPTGGGGQNMRPPSPDKEDSQPIAQVPTPPTPQPQPQPQPVVTPPQPQPLPKPEVVKAPTPEPTKIKPITEPVEAVKPPKHTVTVSTDLVTTTKKDDQTAKEAAAKKAADRAAKAAAESQRLAAAFSKATRSLKGGFAGGTDIKFNAGFGGSGPAYANWLQIIQTIYYNDWSQRAPSGVSDDTIAGVATVTISHDGTVLSSRISKTSGNSSVDHSIQSTLDHVKFTRPFPETSKEDQTELQIYFNLTAVKQLMG